jgi:phosphoribosylanthranilate isomerase
MWIKICGIRDVETAVQLARCNINAIGLNFYEGSPRAITCDVASEVVRRLPTAVTAIGVFVNHTARQIAEICGKCGIMTVQLHGDEPVDLILELPRQLQVIRAFRVNEAGMKEVANYLAECRQRGANLWACLLDARVEGQYGGTGLAAPWHVIAGQWQYEQWPRLVLAGGLTPGNVGKAIQTVRPFGVDVAGGVERGLGCKDAALVRDFAQQASSAH